MKIKHLHICMYVCIYTYVIYSITYCVSSHGTKHIIDCQLWWFCMSTQIQTCIVPVYIFKFTRPNQLSLSFLPPPLQTPSLYKWFKVTYVHLLILYFFQIYWSKACSENTNLFHWIFTVDLATYNAVLSIVSFLKDGPEQRWQLQQVTATHWLPDYNYNESVSI